MVHPNSRRSPGGRSPTSRPARAAAAAGLTLLLALAPAAGAGQRTTREQESSVAAILRGLDGADERSIARAATELHALGPAALDPMIDVLVADAVGAPGTSGTPGNRAVGPTRVRALTTALGRFPPEALLRSLKGRLATEPAEAERVACLRLLAATGGADGLPVAIDFARPTRLSDAPAPAIEAELEHALTEILRRDPRAYIVAAIVLPGAPPTLQAPAARAIGAMKDARGLELLERLLGGDPLLEALVVTQATRLLPLASVDQAEPFLEPLRDHLLDGDDSLRRSAALALGRLEDVGAIPNLAQLLDDADGRPCREAHWALCRIAGLSLPPERAAWEGWYEEERRWFQEEAPALFERLRSADPATMVDAVRQLSRRRLHREPIAEFLAKGLGHEDPQVRLVLVSGLEQLGGSTARAALEDARDDPDETVRLRAAAALEAQ
jgi:HEAT repeat protein